MLWASGGSWRMMLGARRGPGGEEEVRRRRKKLPLLPWLALHRLKQTLCEVRKAFQRHRILTPAPLIPAFIHSLTCIYSLLLMVHFWFINGVTLFGGRKKKAQIVFGELHDVTSTLNYKALLNLYTIKDLLTVNGQKIKDYRTSFCDRPGSPMSRSVGKQEDEYMVSPGCFESWGKGEWMEAIDVSLLSMWKEAGKSQNTLSNKVSHFKLSSSSLRSFHGSPVVYP